jgi:hypothetical protein
MIEAFRQKKAPGLFLSGFFKTPARNITKSRKVVIDIQRSGEQYAVDVVRGTGGRLSTRKRFTTKEYIPPVYDQFVALGEEELMERMPGQTEYDSPDFAAMVMAIISDEQTEQQEMILRSIEYQAAQAFFTGQIVLVNGDTIDFKQKATHNYEVGTSWSDSGGTPIDDIQLALNLNRKDGKVDSDIAIMSEESFADFIANAQVVAQADLRRIDRLDIKPPSMNTEGAAFHGTFSVGAYRIQLWTYPQFYQVPEGFGLANEGELLNYIPSDRVLITSSKARFDLLFAGIPSVANRNDPRLAALGLAGIPTNIATDFHPYSHLDEEVLSIKAGVRSAPLCVPTQIDAFTVIDTVA